MRPPIGLAYDTQGRLVPDPDQQIQRKPCELSFTRSSRTGSATTTVREFRRGWHPVSPTHPFQPDEGREVIWGKLEHSHVLHVCCAQSSICRSVRLRSKPDAQNAI